MIRPPSTPPVSGIAGAGSAGRRSGLPPRRPAGTACIQSRVSTPIRAGSAGARSEDAHIGKGGRAEDLETQHRDATPRIGGFPDHLRCPAGVAIGSGGLAGSVSGILGPPGAGRAAHFQ